MNAADVIQPPPNFKASGETGNNSSSFVTFGSGLVATLAPRSLAFIPSGPFLSNPFPNAVGTLPVQATVSLLPAGRVTPIKAKVISADGAGVTFLVPPETPIGQAEVIYKLNAQASTQWAEVEIAPASFQLYRSGNPGPVIAQDFASDGKFTYNGLAAPARDGQIVSVWGTGLGAGAAQGIQVQLGGITARVIYAGPAPGYEGLDQINFQVPTGVADGCYVALTVFFGGRVTTTSMSKTADGAACNHPWNLTAADLKSIDNLGALRSADVYLATNLTAVSNQTASRSETASVNASIIDAGRLTSSFLNPPSVLQSSCSPLPFGQVLGGVIGAVRWVSVSGFLLGTLSPYGPLDLGSPITLTHAGTSLKFENPYGNYSQWSANTGDAPLGSLIPVIDGGQWTWRSPGSKDLVASSLDFTLPAPIQISGGAPVMIDRGQAQTFTWKGGSYTDGFQFTANLTANNTDGSSTGIFCRGDARSGSVTFPADLLSKLQPNTLGSLTVNVSQASGSAPHTKLPLQDGSSLLLQVQYNASDRRPVQVR